MDIELELNQAEMKAWHSLAGYKFIMFGYWAAIWVHLNKLDGCRRQNPFQPLVQLAASIRRERIQEAAGLKGRNG